MDPIMEIKKKNYILERRNKSNQIKSNKPLFSLFPSRSYKGWFLFLKQP